MHVRGTRTSSRKPAPFARASGGRRLRCIEGASLLAQFERCKRVLREELGIVPEAETLALYQRISDGTFSARNLSRLPAATLPPARDLPPLAARLIGPETALAMLVARLRQGRPRLLTLTGPPGIGKTRLALEIARELQADFDDGVCLVALAPIRDPALVAAAIAQALDIKANGEQPAAFLDESIAYYQRMGDKGRVAWATNGRGDVALYSADASRALALYNQSLALFREVDDSWGRAVVLRNLGRLALSKAMMRRRLNCWRSVWRFPRRSALSRLSHGR
jgi:hypothetical protein